MYFAKAVFQHCGYIACKMDIGNPHILRFSTLALGLPIALPFSMVYATGVILYKAARRF